MRYFEVHLRLDHDDEISFEEGATAQAIWNDLSTGADYITFTLIDKDKQKTILSGDTTHNDIMYAIMTFVDGMQYITTDEINITYWVDYINGTKVKVEK